MSSFQRRPSSESQHHDVSKLRSQIEIEKKARRDAEEKYKQVVAKMDVLQQRLQDKHKEVEEEREAKEDVVKSNQSLEMTISKMEEYLRKKNARFENINPDPESGRMSAFEEMIKNESEMNKISSELIKERKVNSILQKRCELLEKLLKENNISVDNYELKKLNTEFTNADLDF